MLSLVTPVTCANVPGMNNIDQEILELAKRDYGENCELVKRTEWSYSFKWDQSLTAAFRDSWRKRISRLVSAAEIRQRWRSMNEWERMDFASNFPVKQAWTDSDTEILEIIMNDGNVSTGAVL